ncbi:MAG: diguanylate cyclase [Propionibacteriales bacterium]|nr:diguanylate cyclase [Propionibacteriales bacterium]
MDLSSRQPQSQDADDDAEALRLLRSSDHPIVHSFPHGAVVVVDHELRYLSAGGLGLADVGLSRELLEGKTIWEAFPPETAALIDPLYRAALAGVSSTYDVPYGGRIFTQRLAPVLGPSGRVIAAMGFTQDVTEARLGEQQLRESTQRFRLAFEHAPIGKAIVGLDGTFTEVNPALCRLLGYPSEKLRTLTFQEITHPDDLEADLAQVAQLVDGQIANYSMEKRYLTAGGDLVWVLLTASVVQDDDGAPLYFIAQIQDISDRKAREHAIAEANAAAAARLEHAAMHDDLTGLPNRRLIEQQLSHLLEPSDRRAVELGVAVLFCDLDGFKAVNDVHGHDAGDSLLRGVAERLSAAARSGDIIGRLGGDEFVVLVRTGADNDVPAVTAAIAERICSSLAAPFQGPGATPMTVSVSIGVALPKTGVDAAEMLSRADAAMYLAKRAGKNGYAYHQPND